MDLDELKKSMSTLDDLLAEKSNNTITLNTKTCNTAQKKIAKMYCLGAFSFAILIFVFLVAWNAGLGKDAFPFSYKLFLEIYLVIGAIWYSYIYFKTKKINIAVSTPMQTLRQVASLRLYALVGEIVLGIAMVVFLTLFLSNLWVVGPYRFWIISSALVVLIILEITIFIPKTIRYFQNLTAIQ